MPPTGSARGGTEREAGEIEGRGGFASIQIGSGGGKVAMWGGSGSEWVRVSVGGGIRGEGWTGWANWAAVGSVGPGD